MLKAVIMISAMMLFLSCNSENHGGEIKVGDLKVIKVNEDDAENLKMSDVFESVKYIRLQTDTNNLMGAVTKIKRVKDNFYLQTSKAVFVYNVDGALINSIKRVGEGEGEFRGVTDFWINGENEEIEILDHKSQKIVKYKIDGKYINEWKINLIARSFVKLNENIYAFNCSTEQPDVDLLYSFILKSRDSDKILMKQLPYNPKQAEYRNFIDKSNFSIQGNSATYSVSGTDSIFNFTDKEFKVEYFLDFGKKAVPEKTKYSKYQDVSVYIGAIAKNGGYGGIYNNFIYEDSLRLVALPNVGIDSRGISKKILLVYSKPESKNIIIRSLEDDIVFSGQKEIIWKDFVPLGAANGEIYSVLEAARALERLEEIESSSTEQEWKVLTSKNKSLMSLSSKTSLGDNPILRISVLKRKL